MKTTSKPWIAGVTLSVEVQSRERGPAERWKMRLEEGRFRNGRVTAPEKPRNTEEGSKDDGSGEWVEDAFHERGGHSQAVKHPPRLQV